MILGGIPILGETSSANTERFLPSTRQRLILLLILLACVFISIATDNVSVPLAAPDAIVLLAGDDAERAPFVAQLYAKMRPGLVLLTNDGVLGGWSQASGRNLFQVEWAVIKLVNLGIPRTRIVILPFHGSSTMNDAIAVKGYVKHHPLTRIAVVTSGYHTRRAFWVFRKVFSGTLVKVGMYPAESVAINIRSRLLEPCKQVFYWLRYGMMGD